MQKTLGKSKLQLLIIEKAHPTTIKNQELNNLWYIHMLNDKNPVLGHVTQEIIQSMLVIEKSMVN